MIPAIAASTWAGRPCHEEESHPQVAFGTFNPSEKLSTCKTPSEKLATSGYRQRLEYGRRELPANQIYPHRKGSVSSSRERLN
jgi:hypothetical protein